MNINTLLTIVKYKLRYGFTVEWYNFWYQALRRRQRIIPRVATIDETIETIVAERCSVSRYGDGEMLLTDPLKNIGFQQGNEVLAARLREIITSQNDGHLVCISDTFSHLERFNRKARRFWRTHFFIYGSWWDQYLQPDRLYYNTFVTRPYMDYALKEDSARWFKKMKQIWDNRDVVFIEGEKSRLGVGNDLFDNVHSIRRILCPAQNAFSRYDEIIGEAKKMEKSALFLIALGPTATVLAYDLFKAGYQAIDAGHVDIEYEWWRMGATHKVKLERKYVNEAADGKDVADGGSEYNSQIIAKII